MFLVPAIAVVVILAAVWFLGTRDVSGLSSEDAVRRLIRAEHPEFDLDEVVCSTDGRSAIASQRSGPAVGVAFVVGNQCTSRVLSSGDVGAVTGRQHGDAVRLTIRTHDLGCPVLRLQLSPERWPAWRARLETLAGG